MASISIEPFAGNFAQTYRDNNMKPMLLWDNVFTRDNVSTTGGGSTPDGPVINALDENTVDYWEAATVGGRSIYADLTRPTTVNCIAISRHNLGSGGGIVSVWQDGVQRYISRPADDGVFIMIFPDLVVNSEFRIGLGSSSNPVKITNIMAGKRLVIPNGIDGTGFNPIEFSTRTQLVQNETLAGNLLGNYVTRSGVEIDIPFNFVEREFIYGDFKGFNKHYNEGRPFFMASSPALLPNDAGLLWRDGSDMDISLTDIGYNATFSMPARGIVA